MPLTHDQRPLYEVKANLFKGLAHPHRICILELLAGDPEVSVATSHTETGLEASHLSQHLSVLRKHRLVVSAADPPDRRGGHPAGRHPVMSTPGTTSARVGAVLRNARSLLPSPADYRETKRSWAKDLIAGFTVGIVALPSALGFGGSHVQISGPTGALAVVLVPIVASQSRTRTSRSLSSPASSSSWPDCSGSGGPCPSSPGR